MELHHTNFWNWGDRKFRFEVYLSNDFSNLNNIEQVCGLVLNKTKDKILLAHSASGKWFLPGGAIEKGESLLDTLVREIKEETNCEIILSTVVPFFYQDSYEMGENEEWKFRRREVRYIAMISEEHDFVADPDNGDVDESRWVLIHELEKYLDWGETVEMMKEKLRSSYEACHKSITGI